MSRRARRYAEATAAKRGDLMAQDLSPGLTAWLTAQPDARLHAREAAQAIEDERDCCAECGGPALEYYAARCPNCGAPR